MLNFFCILKVVGRFLLSNTGVKDGDNWCFYSGNTMLIGWLDIDGGDMKKTYYFTKEGLMVSCKWLEMTASGIKPTVLLPEVPR